MHLLPSPNPAGIATVEGLMFATSKDLGAIKGISEQKVAKLKEIGGCCGGGWCSLALCHVSLSVEQPACLITQLFYQCHVLLSLTAADRMPSISSMGPPVCLAPLCSPEDCPVRVYHRAADL